MRVHMHIHVGSLLTVPPLPSIQTAGRVCQKCLYPDGSANWKTGRRNRQQPV